MMKTAFFLLPIYLGLAACASTGPREMELILNNRTDDARERIGVHEDKVIIQKHVYLEEQLWELKAEVDELQRTLYGKSRQDAGGLWAKLKECRTRTADPRIGGMGRSEAMEPWANITKQDEAFFYRVDERTHSLTGVTEEMLDERMQRYQTHKRLLMQRFDELNDKLDACEEKYALALVQHGLNPDDTRAKGEWVEGPQGYRVWQMRRTPTTDPEELMRRKEQKVRGYF